MIYPGQAPEHDADHGQANEGFGGSDGAFELSREAAVAADPCKRAFDDPALGKDDETVKLVSLDDLDCPRSCPGGGLRDAWSLIAGVGVDAFDEGKQPPRMPIEDEPRAIPVLNVSGMHDNIQEKACRIDEDMSLAARDFLARIIALRVERGAPF